MQDASLVYPMFAMVLLTFSTLLRLFRTRVGLVREGAVNAAYFKVYQGSPEPEASAKLARHFVNLFEAPTLFYVACLAAMVSEQSTLVVNGLAWLYVALRCVHIYIHTGSNQLNHRIAAYFSSWFVLVILWVCIVFGVASR